ncbi:MAG: bifunctional phosphopantothenoylcysteine decarboxylase/phosphopantothenate--cysteine ligase CoaBC [Actinobacteria bacterium]|nr:bifunctional phosphopantothenoylcysteine decarboxylase/phosphopantothenate--cysteine ligase CoaBC [Actinomycetota bacterium]
MPEPAGKNVLIGVTGGIAAYKVAELARMLVRGGISVKVIMTSAGQQFVTPLTFRTITGNPVATSMWSDPASPLPHISLSEEADLILVAPATANVIAKYAKGVADDLLSTTLLAARGTVIIAPAMNTRMYLHPSTQENIAALRKRGVVIVEPGEGELACGDEGIGRMAEPSEVMEVLERELRRTSDLADKRLVITAGATREHLDPVRFISNPSTGRMGFAIAERASRRGAGVVLVSGPTNLACPAGVKLVQVVSAAEMKQAVIDNMAGADALVMAAAVADFRPAARMPKKIKKRDGIPEIKLEPTEDIINVVKKTKPECLVVGFAAETDNVVENARKKLTEKGMGLVVANRVGEPDTGFGADTNMAAVISPGDEKVELAMVSKSELAELLLDRIAEIL